MKVTVFYNGDYSDQITFSCEDIQTAKDITYFECIERGWNPDDCHSEIVK